MTSADQLRTTAIILDVGALIAVDRLRRHRLAGFHTARHDGVGLVTHPLVVDQVWRHGRQAVPARFLKGVDVRAVDENFGRRCGELLGKAGMDDPVDAAVVLLAHDGDRIVTSNPDDIQRLVDASGRDVRVVPV